MGGNGVEDPNKGRTVLELASAQDGPEALTDLASTLTARALSNRAILDHKTHGLFGGVVSWINLRGGDELEVTFTMLDKTLDHVLNEPWKLEATVAYWRSAWGHGRLPNLVFGQG